MRRPSPLAGIAKLPARPADLDEREVYLRIGPFVLRITFQR
jgi:hypothetical protein